MTHSETVVDPDDLEARDSGRAAEAGAERDEAATDARSRRVWPLRLVAVLAGACALVWAVVAVLCASRGFDPTDESFYLLSYRWWDVNFDTFTGAQYFYGPVFEALGYNIAGLRIVRLVVLLLTHGLFGWEFMRWLRLQRPATTPSRWWEVAGTAAIVASSGMVYSWLPLSPGYNDLALTGTVLATAATMRIARDVQTTGRPRWWAASGLGAIAAVLLLTKWSSAMVVLLCIALTLLVVVGALGVRRLLVLVAQGAAGGVAMLAFVQLVLVPLPTILRPMLKVNSAVAGGTNSPSLLAEYYYNQAKLVADSIVHQQWPVLVAAVLTAGSRRFPRTTAVLAAVAIGYGVWQVVDHGGIKAGSINLPTLSVTIFTPLLVAAVVGLVSAVVPGRRDAADGTSGGTSKAARTRWSLRVHRWAIYVLLLLLPVAQAAGTGNPIHYLALIGLGLWMAVVIAILTSLPRAALAPRLLVTGAVAALVVSTMLVAVDGLWNRPYRASDHDDSTVTVAGVPALSSVKLDPKTAYDYAQLHERLLPYVKKPGRAMMGFDGLSGMVYLLDGRPVGEAWYAGADPTRSSAAIRRACQGGHPWWGDREPIIMFSRPVTRVERQTLRMCGLTLRDDYTSFTMYINSVFYDLRLPLKVYVPRDEAAAQ